MGRPVDQSTRISPLSGNSDPEQVSPMMLSSMTEPPLTPCSPSSPRPHREDSDWAIRLPKLSLRLPVHRGSQPVYPTPFMSMPPTTESGSGHRLRPWPCKSSERQVSRLTLKSTAPATPPPPPLKVPPLLPLLVTQPARNFFGIPTELSPAVPTL